MVVDPLFSSEKDVEDLVAKLIIPHIDPEDKERFETMLVKWEGREADVINVMHYAIQQEKFGEYADKLDEMFELNIARIPKADRRSSVHPLVGRAERALEKIYESLGIEPTDGV
jgi:hypothetical protein